MGPDERRRTPFEMRSAAAGWTVCGGRRKPHQAARRGSVYVVALMFLLLLSSYSASILMRGAVGLNASQRYGYRNAAFSLAEAAVDLALMKIRTDDMTAVPTTALGGGSCWAEIVATAPLIRTITAHGLASGVQSNVEVVVQLAPKPVFQYGLFGAMGIRIDRGGLTDSYDSRQGPYDPLHAMSHGTIGTNNTASASIELKQGTAINGHVVVGSGLSDPLTAVAQDATVVITGIPPVLSAPQPLPLPAVDTSGLSCSQDLVLPKDGTFTFVQANSPYCYASISLGKNSAIQVSGDVQVYTGSLSVDKESTLNVNANGRPTQLVMMITSNSSVEFDKEGTFVGALYAPHSNVTFKKELDVYGSVVARHLEVNKDASFHYDEALKELVAPVAGYTTTILAWRDL